MSVFIVVFWILSTMCLVLQLYTRTRVEVQTSVPFKAFQRVYLSVYLLAQLGDWLQGPHVYALYASYGMSASEIEQLFVAGFGSSMIIGTVIGSFADRYGRRANCILYGVLYGLACVTKHFPNFWVLMCGRLLGGTATSILFSAFESWLVCEHKKRGFTDTWLSYTFSSAFLGNSIIAILAGLIAEFVAERFGFVAPFDVSLIVLVIMCIVIVSTWTENYGDTSGNMVSSFKDGFHVIATDQKVMCLGIIQSLFEGAMYSFVLEWTPALTPAEQEHATSASETIPHGWIFAAFMVAVMIGSNLFKLFSKFAPPENFMRIVFVVATMSLFVPIALPHDHTSIFLGFIVFEVCVGIFWPALGTMRGKYIPEETRSTIMNVFRIPLNMIVVFILLQNLPLKRVFQCCVAFLGVCVLVQEWLYRLYLQLPADKAEKEPALLQEAVTNGQKDVEMSM